MRLTNLMTTTMAQRNGLLTPADVVAMTPVTLPFSPCPLRELYLIEYAEGLRTLGELWVNMVKALADYTTATRYVDRPGGYAAGEVVIYNGAYRVAAAATTEDPSNASAWPEAPKFVGACAEVYADLYCNFVGPYLSYTVLAERFPYLVTQIGDRGVDYGGRKYNIQDKELMDSLLRAIYRDRAKVKSVLEHFLVNAEPTAATCLAGYPGLDKLDGPRCGCGSESCNGCATKPKFKETRRESIGRTRWG